MSSRLARNDGTEIGNTFRR